MNANELIKYWDNQPSNIAEQTASMLRQLQAENEALKADNKRLKGFCWETDEAKEFLEAVRKAQE